MLFIQASLTELLKKIYTKRMLQTRETQSKL